LQKEDSLEVNKRAKVYGVPVYVRFSTYDAPEVRGQNFFYDILLRIVLFIAVEICFVEEFCIEVEDDNF